MNATELIVSLFLTMSCYTTDVRETKIGADTFKVTAYNCITHTFTTWQRFCAEGHGFWGRVFMIREQTTGETFYVNRFGEIMAGQFVAVDEIYLPACGA